MESVLLPDEVSGGWDNAITGDVQCWGLFYNQQLGIAA